jgi:transcriptional regulator with XRE-family HTH domain
MGHAMSTFGDELCRLLAERGMSQRELARRANYDAGHINKICRGTKPATAKLAARLDAVLGAGGALVALVSRRTVLAGAAAIAGAPLLGALDAERLAWAQRHPPRIDHAVVESLADVLAAQRRAEDSIGPRAVMKPVLAQLAEIEDLVRQARGSMRPALVEVAQQWAQYGAYLHRDNGNPAGDRALLSQALEWAEEVGDRTMAATVFVQRGNMALAAGELGTAIGLAQAAQRDKTVDAGQRAEGTDLEARAHAQAGDAAAAERKIDETADLAGQLTERAQDRHQWLYWMTPAFFECARGAAFGLLADEPRYRERAVAALEAGYAGLPDDQRSSAWTAPTLARLAGVHVRAGDVEEASAVALQCADIARLTGSVRLRGMLTDLHAGMAARWPGDPRVTELADALR